MELGKITITTTLADDGDILLAVEIDNNGTDDKPPLMEVLGMLRLAEDSVIREYMGEDE